VFEFVSTKLILKYSRRSKKKEEKGRKLKKVVRKKEKKGETRRKLKKLQIA
jgi:hypothetical protein